MTQRAIKKLVTMGEERQWSKDSKSSDQFPVAKYMALPNGVRPDPSASGSVGFSSAVPRHREQTALGQHRQPVRGVHYLENGRVLGTPGSLTVHSNPRAAAYVITHSPDRQKAAVYVSGSPTHSKTAVYSSSPESRGTVTGYGGAHRPGRQTRRVNTPVAAVVTQNGTSSGVTGEVWTKGVSVSPRYQKRAQSTPPQVYRSRGDRLPNTASPGQHSSGPNNSSVYDGVNGWLSAHRPYETSETSADVSRDSTGVEEIPLGGEAARLESASATTPISQHYSALPTGRHKLIVGNTKDTDDFVIPTTSNGEFIMMGNYYDPQELYGTHSRTSNLAKSRGKFSSMPSLFGSKELDKKAMKKEMKRIKEEEKRLKKEEKKRRKMEKKYATVGPRIMQNNWNTIQRPIEDVYRRPKLRLRAVHIDFEDGPSSRPPSVPPPPPPDVGLRRRYLHASAPDLLRIEQVYGSLSRERPPHQPTSVYQRSDYAPRMVVLHKGPEGFGFVLRGARSQSHTGTLDFQPTAEFPALQYLDSVDVGSQADRVGLKAGDFLLEINGENVVRASHERVVQLIRTARSTLAMKVVTVRPLQHSNDWLIHNDGSMTLPNRKRQAPAPPRRDPQTSLSYSKATSKSMAEGLAEIEKLDQTLAEYEGSQHNRRASMPNDAEPKTASVRASHSAKRMSVVDLDNILVSEKPDYGKTKSKDYVSPSELRILKYHKKQNGSVGGAMERSKSTPDLAGELVLSKPENIYARSGVEAGTGAAGRDNRGGAAPGSTWSKSHVSSAVKTHEPASLRGPIYMTPGVKRPVTYIDPKVLHAAVSSGSASKLHLNSQEDSPYSVPQVPARQPTPKRPAPPPPTRAEVVSISTTANSNSTYANVSEEIKAKKAQMSPYESSFRPGTLARLTKQPQESTASLEQAKLRAHQRSASAGHIVPPGDETDKAGGSTEDKVYESAKSFIQKHPNATLLVTADVHKGQKKGKNFYEPEPDYDQESDEEKSAVSSRSNTRVTAAFNRQSSTSSQQSSPSRSTSDRPSSVTVISVGGDSSVKSSPQNKRYTIHSDIPSSSGPVTNDPSIGAKIFIPPRPSQPAPLPPSVPSSSSSSRRSSVQSNLSGERDMSSDRISMVQHSSSASNSKVQSIQSHYTPPPQSAPPPPPPAGAPPPPPPPPPPASNPPSLRPSTEAQPPKPTAQSQPKVSADDIMAAVAKRKQRLQSDGPQMAPERPVVATGPKSKLELNHEALKAAVAKRKNLLEKVDDETVVDTIETKLQKTKKLQSAKYFFSSDTINRKDAKPEQPETVYSTLKTKKSVAAPPPPAVKPAPASTAVPEPVAKPTSLASKASNGKSTVKETSPSVKETSPSVKETSPSVKETLKESSPPSVKDSTPSAHKSPPEPIQPSDYLAAAEKRRQEWLQKKSNSSVSVFDSGTIKKTTTAAPKSNTTSSNKIEVIPLKKDSAVVDDSKVSIRDRIAKLEKAKLSMNGTSKTVGNVELVGVTEDHSHTEAGLTLSRNKKGLQNGTNYPYVAPPPEFGDKSGKNAHGLVQIDIIPPPAHFANESSTDEHGHHGETFGSAFGHDDAASLVSSVSTLSTLSSEQGDGSCGSPPAKHGQTYDLVVAPPPPGFDDSSEQMYDEIQSDETIPPPMQFGNGDGKSRPMRPFQSKSVESWLCTDVMDWLDSVGMGQYRSSFAKNCIDGPKLLGLGRNDYIELGVVQVGHRMNLERSIKKVAMRKTAL